MKYFPRSAAGYICPKLKDVRFGDYEVFLQAHLREFDVIITGGGCCFYLIQVE